jgi:CheY-like chemotaxis protein
MTPKRVLSAGQCGFDHHGIARTLNKAFGAEVEPADTPEEVLEQLRQGAFDLVLVNRVLDADGSSGLDLIRRIKEDEQLRPVPVMLVSNHEDAQAEAVRAGAERGFGKAELGHAQMIERVRLVFGAG